MRSIWDLFIMQLVYGYVAMSSYTPCQSPWYYELPVLLEGRGSSFKLSRWCLPRRRRCQDLLLFCDYKSATSFPHRAPTPTTHTPPPPLHHKLTGTHYHNLLRISHTRARACCKHCQRASAAVEIPHARHTRARSTRSRRVTHSIRPSTLLTQYNRTPCTFFHSPEDHLHLITSLSRQPAPPCTVRI
jgi:hypothetical protein